MTRRLLIIGLGLLMATGPSFGAVVLKIKNSKILIDSEGVELKPNQYFLLINKDNKKTAIVKILAIKDGKAVAETIKGDPEGNERLVIVAKKAAATETNKEQNAEKESRRDEIYATKRNEGLVNRAALLVGSFSNTLKVTVNDNVSEETLEATGKSIGLAGAYEYKVSSWFSFYGLATYEQFKSEGSSTILGCNGQTSTACNTAITFLGAGGFLRVNLDYSPAIYWLGFGIFYKSPLSKNSTALTETNIKASHSTSIALGFDYSFGGNYFIPVIIQKQVYGKIDSSTLSSTSLHIGIGKSF